MLNSYKMLQVCGVMMDCVPLGTKVWIEGEKKPYTVRATNRFYSIITKPYNPQKTVLYSIVDWRNMVMGTENLIFCLGAKTDEECKNMLDRVTSGETEISHRNIIELNVTKMKLPFK